MLSRLSKGLTEKEKTELRADFVAARPFLDRLIEVLQEDMITVDKQGSAENLFDSPSWAYKQAYLMGQRRNACSVIEMIKEDK